MNERLNTRKKNRAPRLALFSLGATLLVLTGCGITVDANDSKTEKLEECGGAAIFDRKSEKPEIEDIDTYIDSVQNKLNKVYTRVSSVDNSIEIPETDDQIRPTKIETSKSKITISFESTNSNDVYDEMIFDMKNDKSLEIPIGAIACTSGDGIYPTLFVDALEETIDYTSQISE